MFLTCALIFGVPKPGQRPQRRRSPEHSGTCIARPATGPATSPPSTQSGSPLELSSLSWLLGSPCGKDFPRAGGPGHGRPCLRPQHHRRQSTTSLRAHPGILLLLSSIWRFTSSCPMSSSATAGRVYYRRSKDLSAADAVLQSRNRDVIARNGSASNVRKNLLAPYLVVAHSPASHVSDEVPHRE